MFELAQAEKEAQKLQEVVTKAKTKQEELVKAQKSLAEAQAKLEPSVKLVEKLMGELETIEMEYAGLTGMNVRKAAKVKQSNGASRGRKECPKCHAFVGARTQECNCGHKFVAKKEKDHEGGRGRRVVGEDLASMIVKVLARNSNGLKLAEIGKKVLAGGYKTDSDHIAQAVYNALNKLRKEEKITKNEESKKYSLSA